MRGGGAVEKWLPVVGYEELYKFSDMGRVRSLERVVTQLSKEGTPIQRRRRARVLAPQVTRHSRVGLHRNGLQENRLVHRLVLEAFVGPCPSGLEACHANDIGTDNRLSNLRWDTRQANTLDMVRNGIHNMARKTHCKHGHPFDRSNTYVDPSSGQRCCRECKRQRYQRRAA